MWSALTLGGGRNELNLKWGRSTIMLCPIMMLQRSDSIKSNSGCCSNRDAQIVFKLMASSLARELSLLRKIRSHEDYRCASGQFMRKGH